jgi:hypothetical protein
MLQSLDHVFTWNYPILQIINSGTPFRLVLLGRNLYSRPTHTYTHKFPVGRAENHSFLRKGNRLIWLVKLVSFVHSILPHLHLWGMTCSQGNVSASGLQQFIRSFIFNGYWILFRYLLSCFWLCYILQNWECRKGKADELLNPQISSNIFIFYLNAL